jgi:hypothetical protein
LSSDLRSLSVYTCTCDLLYPTVSVVLTPSSKSILVIHCIRKKYAAVLLGSIFVYCSGDTFNLWSSSFFQHYLFSGQMEYYNTSLFGLSVIMGPHTILRISSSSISLALISHICSAGIPAEDISVLSSAFKAQKHSPPLFYDIEALKYDFTII